MALKLPKISIKMPALFKNKKIMIIIAAVLVAVLLTATVLMLFGNKKDKTPQASSSSSESSESSSASSESNSESAPPEPTPTPAPKIITGSNITQIGMCVILPKNSGIEDPNATPAGLEPHPPMTTYNNGKYTEVALYYADNSIAMSTMTVLSLQAFEVGEASPEAATYEVVAELGKKKQYTYDEISDKILYNADGILVVDVTFARGVTPKSIMEERIDKRSGAAYSYDWMPSAFDYIKNNIKDMVVPIQYAPSYSLEALGYTFEFKTGAGEPPCPVAVSAKTVKAEEQGENGHSGLYTADVYGGERLLGDYTVLQPTYSTESSTPVNPSSFALLQAFKKVDLERSGAGIKFLRRDKPKSAGEDYFKGYTEGPFSEFALEPLALKNYIVYENEAIVVYDFFDFAKPPELEAQLEGMGSTEGYEQYGVKIKNTVAICNAVVNAEGGLGQHIKKK